MITTSISQLKVNPSSAIAQAVDYPVVIQNRNKVQAYLVGKNLYEKMVTFIEDYIDAQTAKKADFSKGRDFEKLAQELGV